jgi:hypothetical protein
MIARPELFISRRGLRPSRSGPLISLVIYNRPQVTTASLISDYSLDGHRAGLPR